MRYQSFDTQHMEVGLHGRRTRHRDKQIRSLQPIILHEYTSQSVVVDHLVLLQK